MTAGSIEPHHAGGHFKPQRSRHVGTGASGMRITLRRCPGISKSHTLLPGEQ